MPCLSPFGGRTEDGIQLPLGLFVENLRRLVRTHTKVRNVHAVENSSGRISAQHQNMFAAGKLWIGPRIEDPHAPGKTGV